MPQLRIMDDDPRRAAEVMDRLLQLLAQDDAGLRAGTVTRLSHRGGGGRYVVNVELDDASEPGPVWVAAERVDDRHARQRRHGRRTLPPA